MLRVRELDAFYGRSQALFGMELQVDAGEVVTLMGRNGMGKTTTVHTIMGLMPPRRGTVEFEGARVDGLPAFRIARLGLGLVPWRLVALCNSPSRTATALKPAAVTGTAALSSIASMAARL